MSRRRVVAAALLAVPLLGASWRALPATAAALPQPASLTAPARQLEPVVLTGSQFPDWSAGPEITARAPQVPTDYGVADAQGMEPAPLQSDCYQASPSPDVNGGSDASHGDHNCYQQSQLPVRTLPGRTGVDTNSLRGYRWDGERFVQIPFQVDTKWIHYISNNASGFAFYSGVDQETTYTFDREGFRYTTNRPFDPHNPSIVCHSQPAGGRAATPDPNPGLIDTDEMAFMARDAGAQAPSGTGLPRGIVDAHEVRITDPVSGGSVYVYVMRSAPGGRHGYAVEPAFTAANSPYVAYRRDPNADLFVYSQSSYGNYGAAGTGPVCNPDGTPAIGQGFARNAAGQIVLDPKTFVQRRPLDTATVTTPRYRFRYDGRWVMDSIQVSPDDKGLRRGDYGPNLVDRWKARAFQQSPGGQTPCCGYEEETTNWGGSSQLMGEKTGPVRVIRVTWGADSSTNNVRTEIFYPEEVVYQDNLRVHVIPPFDGIYTQRDMAAGMVTTYYNQYNPAGVPVLGINEEAVGNIHAHVGPDGVSIDSSDTVGSTLRGANGGKPVTVGSPTDNCGSNCIHGDFDQPDLAFSGPPGLLSWEEMDGPHGALVERWNVSHVTPVGTPASTVVTMPYYRDDACFDDGTGTDPGPKLHFRSKDEPTTWGYDPVTHVAVSPAPAGASPVFQRRCWNHHPDGTPYNIPGTLTFDASKKAEVSDPPPNPRFSPQGDIRYFQGDVGTHGLHIEVIADSDNAQLTVPVTEIDSEQRQVILHGSQGNVGEQYGHSFDKPLVATVSPVAILGQPLPAPASTDAGGASTAGAPDAAAGVAPASVSGSPAASSDGAHAGTPPAQGVIPAGGEGLLASARVRAAGAVGAAVATLGGVVALLALIRRLRRRRPSTE